MQAATPILIVDDDPIVQAVIERIVTKAGYRALLASTASEAVALLDAEPTLRLATIDQNLPHMSGFALIARLRERAPGLRTIMITGDDIPRKPPSGPDRFLGKPFRHSVLLEMLAELASTDDA